MSDAPPAVAAGRTPRSRVVPFSGRPSAVTGLPLTPSRTITHGLAHQTLTLTNRPRAGLAHRGLR